MNALGLRLLAAVIGLLICIRFSAAQTPAGTDFLRNYNQEAMTSDSAGVHKYARDLIELIVPDRVGKSYLGSLSDRLAKAELSARTGHARLVPEADVVRTYNQLVREIGAPPLFLADEASLRLFRSRAASLHILSALFSADQNGSNCNPGEAVFLIYLLIYNDGKISEHMLEEFSVQYKNKASERESVLSGRLVTMSDHMRGLLSDFAANHRRGKAIKVFDDVAQTLGF